MAVAEGDKTEVRGYSLPKSLHFQLAYEAKKRDVSASRLVRASITHYLDFLRHEDEKRLRMLP